MHYSGRGRAVFTVSLLALLHSGNDQPCDVCLRLGDEMVLDAWGSSGVADGRVRQFEIELRFVVHFGMMISSEFRICVLLAWKGRL